MNNGIDWLLWPSTIRDQAKRIFDSLEEGKTHFLINENKWDQTVDIVWKEMNKNYPDLKIPFHSRWRHFDIGKQRLNKVHDQSIESMLDLCFISVLLDAGAGAEWKYRYKKENIAYGRSEGLALASLEMFENGLFGAPFEVKGDVLKELTIEDLSNGLQVSEMNPLEGLEGRLELLKRLGEVLIKNKSFTNNRPSGILMSLASPIIDAPEFLHLILIELKDIWPQGDKINDQGLGDVWYYRPFGERNDIDAYIPFHKLAQWLTYSIFELLIENKYIINNISGLTGLAEYRNGGLFIDSGFLIQKPNVDINIKWKADSEIIIEWRAITLVLLDKLHESIREKIGLSKEAYPLVRTLEGGTWKAGRELANKLRNGLPPIDIIRDGTIF
ncbi:MAG: URC4/urg3 family protein [Bdellovibrionales bacterium]|nr:URC4/urg3 family protein [Bdellovibrionales bacterium]